MDSLIRNLSSRCLALFAALLLALAQSGVRAQPAYVYSQQELEQLLAPIALYPDALLSQVLVAATYPAQVIEAARWSKDHADLHSEAALRAAEAQYWDPSIASLLAFPQLLEYMRDYLQWTQALGDAFLRQQAQVMDAVQLLRRQAQAAGNLRSDDHLSVIESGSNLILQPIDAQIVYVPDYDPLLAFGTQAWGDYPPVYLLPAPGYYAQRRYAGVFHWGPPVGIPTGLFLRGIDWPQRRVRVLPVIGHDDPATTAPRARTAPDADANRHRPVRPDPGLAGRPTYGSNATPRQSGPVAVPPADNGSATVRRDSPGQIPTPPRPVPVSQTPNAAQMRPQAPAGPQLPRFAPSERREPPRAAEAYLARQPPPAAAPRRSDALPPMQREPAARIQPPTPNSPRAAMQPAQPVARQEPGARFGAHP